MQELAPRLDKQLQTALTEALQAGPAVHERYAATLGNKSRFVEYSRAEASSLEAKLEKLSIQVATNPLSTALPSSGLSRWTSPSSAARRCSK